MPRLKNAMGYVPGYRASNLIFMTVLEGGFVGLPILSVIPPVGSLNYLLSPMVFGLIFFFVIGSVALYSTFYSLKIGKAEASVVEENVRLGDTIHFAFRQKWRQTVHVEFLKVFLVYRERVEYYDGSETQRNDIDRLAQKYEYEGRTYSAGESLSQGCEFQIPDRDMGLRNGYMGYRDAKVQTMWVVKVRMKLGRGEDVWHEYEIEVEASRELETPLVDVEQTEIEELFDVLVTETGQKILVAKSMKLEREELFDVFVTHKPVPVWTPLETLEKREKLVAHLSPVQIGRQFGSGPTLLFERLTPTVAQSVKAQCEDLNVWVELRPTL